MLYLHVIFIILNRNYYFFFLFLSFIYIYILLISFVVHVQVSASEARTGKYHRLVNTPIMYKSHGHRERLINVLQAYTSDCCSVVSRP